MFRLLFVLCGALTPVLCCDWLERYHKLSNDSLVHIQLMGGGLTEQQSPVPFPDKLYRQIYKAKVESQLVFIRDNLELIGCLYRHDNLSSASWDPIRIKHFLDIIYRQAEEVTACVRGQTGRETARETDGETDGLSHCMSTNRTTNPRLRDFYRRLSNSTVTPTGGSVASWELIRKQTVRLLQRLDLLAASIRRRSPPNPQRH
ncbi:interferon a3-like [Dicentrarchus labrax]|uniref:interferon a3-like n=1 Tax=Dicentrarchus labrax TaxID=13489 RepID=UPI0021F52E6A|nr:interferon a3-like [Dicentrarchus labrax]